MLVLSVLSNLPKGQVELKVGDSLAHWTSASQWFSRPVLVYSLPTFTFCHCSQTNGSFNRVYQSVVSCVLSILRSCSTGTNEVGLVELVGFFTCSIGNQPFSVGSVDQFFQPTRNPVELVENYGYRPLSQSWALIHCVMSINTILFNTVGVWCSLSPGIRPCFQLFQPKTVEMHSIGTLQPHQPKPV